MEDETPDRGSTHSLLKDTCLVHVESHPGHMAEDEDCHNQEQDGGVGGLLAAALAGVDGDEDPDIEEDKEQHGHEAKDKEPGPVLVEDSVGLVKPQSCYGNTRVIPLIRHLTFKEFWSIDENCQANHWEDMAAEVPGVASVSVDKRVEDGEVPLYGDGDGHEDAAGEKDVVEGVEEVWKEVVMDLCEKTSDGGRVGSMILKSPTDALGDADNKEEKIKYSKSNEKVVEVALECFLAEDTDGEDVSAHP